MVLFFRTSLYEFPFCKYKTSTLSKFTEPWQYANICLMCQISLHAEFKNFLSSVAEIHLLISSLNIRTCPTRHKTIQV